MAAFNAFRDANLLRVAQPKPKGPVMAGQAEATPNPDASPDRDRDNLIAMLKARHPDAYRLIDALYTKRLIGLARTRLPAKVSAKISPEDVVQSVLRSFFVRSDRGDFDALNDPESYWRVLAKITRRKCGHKADFFLAQRRDAGRDHEVDSAWDAVAQGPSVQEAAVFVETVERLGLGLAPHQVRMLELLLDQQSPSRIADERGARSAWSSGFARGCESVSASCSTKMAKIRFLPLLADDRGARAWRLGTIISKGSRTIRKAASKRSSSRSNPPGGEGRGRGSARTCRAALPKSGARLWSSWFILILNMR